MRGYAGGNSSVFNLDNTSVRTRTKIASSQPPSSELLTRGGKVTSQLGKEANALQHRASTDTGCSWRPQGRQAGFGDEDDHHYDLGCGMTMVTSIIVFIWSHG